MADPKDGGDERSVRKEIAKGVFLSTKKSESPRRFVYSLEVVRFVNIALTLVRPCDAIPCCSSVHDARIARRISAGA
jgi:hypothetical protein